MQYNSFNIIWVFIVSLFHPFKTSFFLSKDSGFFSPLPPSTIEFSIELINSLSPRSVTCSSDCFHHRQFNTKPSHFNHLEGGRVAAVQEKASTNENAIRTTIHHWSFVPRGRHPRGSVSQMLQYIYAPPQNRPISGDAKQIIPLMGDATAFGHVYVISCMIMFMSPL